MMMTMRKVMTKIFIRKRSVMMKKKMKMITKMTMMKRNIRLLIGDHLRKTTLRNSLLTKTLKVNPSHLRRSLLNSPLMERFIPSK